tara:strand:- start:476 stop:1246 length:771 start_codon:yes stop_codon:yes gene_type:complete
MSQVDDERQIWEHYCNRVDLMDENGKTPVKSKFVDPLVNVLCDGYSCSIIASSNISSGEIIEEIPVTLTSYTKDDIVDPVILKSGFIHPRMDRVFDKFGKPFMFVPGNFSIYRQDIIGNAVYDYDRTFNVLTIRALRDIRKSDEIVITHKDENGNMSPDVLLDFKQPNTEGNKKKMGCNCGKNKVTKLVDGTEKTAKEFAENSKIVTPEEFEKLSGKKMPGQVSKEPGQQNKKERPKFKSMVDGRVLKSIDAKKKS